jgi:alkyl sulfatase BDS1-like metallo-beta-lactamase superfamily hydrolase
MRICSHAGELRADLCRRRAGAFADASFTLPRGVLDEVIAKLTTFPEAVAAARSNSPAMPMRLGELMALMDEFPRMFEIVEPKRTAVADGEVVWS